VLGTSEISTGGQRGVLLGVIEPVIGFENFLFRRWLRLCKRIHRLHGGERLVVSGPELI
jgi:hypothetical protein